MSSSQFIEKKIAEYYVNPTTKRADFSMLRGNPLLIKNMAFTGLAHFVFYYCQYLKIIEDKLKAGKSLTQLELLQLKRIYSDQVLLSALTLIATRIFNNKNIRVVRPNNLMEWEASFIDPDNVIKTHIAQVMVFCNIDRQHYVDFKPFIMMPPDYEDTVQSWGPGVWFLRIFTIYCARSWRFSKIITRFLAESHLLLPCTICTNHILMSDEKTSAITLIAYQSSDPDYIGTAFQNEIWLHNLVNKDLIAETPDTVDGLVNMYLDLMKTFFEHINKN